MTTDKPYWEQDIAECLRVAAEIIGPNSYYLRAAEYIDEMRERISKLEAVETDTLDLCRTLEREAAALRADRDALVDVLREIVSAHGWMPTGAYERAKQALAANGGKK